MNSNEDKKCDNQKQKKRNAKIFKSVAICAVMGVFASAIVGLSVALYYAQTSVKTHETYQRQMDAVYRRAYYDLLDGASNLGVSLRKISVSNSPAMQQFLLYEVWNVATLAEDNLSVFGADDEGMMGAQKFVNQLGDFSHSLALKLAKGEKLSVDDRTTLQKLGDIADVYAKALEGVQRKVDSGELDMTHSDALEQFAGEFSTFGEPSFDYPEMIYDGPFSSALETRQVKGLNGEMISDEKGGELLKKYLPGASNVTFLQESKSVLNTLDYKFEMNGTSGYAQIAKRGGMLVMLNVDDKNANKNAREDGTTCQQIAIAFCKNAGFENMQVVWSASSDGECVVNLAPMQNGAVLYPDLVKVKIDENSGMVMGFDASHYAYNHTARDIQPPAISQEDARARLSIDAISEGRLSLIPLRETQEVLAYEFECEKDGTYYIYIDARTGEEVNILYVISDELGERTI